MATDKVCLMSVLVMMILSGNGMVAKGQDDGAADAPAAAIDCSNAMDELNVCNASIGASTPASECCDTLRSLGPQCMCAVFLGPPLPGISRDQAFLLPRNCNLPRISCTAPPDSTATSAWLDAASANSGSVFFLGADDEDGQQHVAGKWPEQTQQQQGF